MCEQHFKVYYLSAEFFKVCNWEQYKIPFLENRPGLLLAIEDEQYPNSLCCIPISKDDDKNGKYANLSQDKPDLVHQVHLNHYQSFLLIQNMFYVRREFIGRPWVSNGVQGEITRDAVKSEIMKKVRRVDQLIKQGKLNFVPRQVVYEIQDEYLRNKTAAETATEIASGTSEPC